MATLVGAAKPRLEGIDAARALALIGMLAVHFGPKDDESLFGRLYAAPHGRASILFAVVAGIGISLLSRRVEARSAAQVRLVSFAILLMPLGLVLEALDHRVAVILHHYAAFFLLGAAALRLSTGNLLGAALGATVFGPLLYFQARLVWPDALARKSVELGDTPVEIAGALLWGGPYPLLTWAAPILWGMWLGRQNFGAVKVLWGMLLGGLAVAALTMVSSDWLLGLLGRPEEPADQRTLLSIAAHSQMPLWLMQAMAVAAAVIGLCLLIGRGAPTLIKPLAATGRLVLSLYVLHLLLLTLWPGLLMHDAIVPAALAVAGFSAAGMLLAWAWPFARGPVEAAMYVFARGLVRLCGMGSRRGDAVALRAGEGKADGR